jgi:hypothetical protein
MYVVICLLVLLPLQASGAALTLPAEPYRQEIGKVRRHNVTYGFSQTASGEFQIQVTVRYRSTWSRLEHVKHVMFRLQGGTIVQRDPKTLVLRLDNREFVVGKHRWWDHPYWQAADAVRLTCNDYKQFETVVVENCRLILEGPAGYGPSSAGSPTFRPLQP